MTTKRLSCRWLDRLIIEITGCWLPGFHCRVFCRLQQNGKKIPPADTCAGVWMGKRAQLPAIWATGGTAAAASTTNGLGGTDWESGTHAGIDKINFYCSTGVQQIVINQEGQTILFVFRIICFWLIQSQSQRGACSATAHESYAQGRINIVLLHIRLEILCCQLCYFKHYEYSLTYYLILTSASIPTGAKLQTNLFFY